jgi:hypothetical protein
VSRWPVKVAVELWGDGEEILRCKAEEPPRTVSSEDVHSEGSQGP